MSDVQSQVTANWTGDTTALVVVDCVQNDFKVAPSSASARSTFATALDGVLTDLSDAWKVAVHEQVYVPESYASWGASDADVDAWNVSLRSVVDSHANAVVVSPNDNGWTPAIHSSSAHPTPKGAELIVDVLLDAVG